MVFESNKYIFTFSKYLFKTIQNKLYLKQILKFNIFFSVDVILYIIQTSILSLVEASVRKIINNMKI